MKIIVHGQAAEFLNKLIEEKEKARLSFASGDRRAVIDHHDRLESENLLNTLWFFLSNNASTTIVKDPVQLAGLVNIGKPIEVLQ